jgi:Mrp family chromosome partitioning ATPase
VLVSVLTLALLLSLSRPNHEANFVYALTPALLFGIGWYLLRLAWQRRRLQPSAAWPGEQLTRPPRVRPTGSALARRAEPVPQAEAAEPPTRRVLHHVHGGRWAADARVVPSEALAQLQRFCDALLLERQLGCRVVRVASGVAACEEKAQCAAQLAFWLAEHESVNVLLVEADLDKPALHELLSLSAPRGYGFSEQLERATRSLAARAQALTRMRLAAGLDALLEASDGNPALFDTPEFAALIARERDDYQFIVLNGPVIGDWPDPLALQQLEASFVFVKKAAAGEDAAALRAANELLRLATSMAVIEV